MISCEFCGKPFETDNQRRGHQIQCRKKYEAADDQKLRQKPEAEPTVIVTSPIDVKAGFLGTSAVVVEGNMAISADIPEPPASIPLSICPPELAYMRKGQLFLQVAGRVDGDRFLIESTKVVR